MRLSAPSASTCPRVQNVLVQTHIITNENNPEAPDGRGPGHQDDSPVKGYITNRHLLLKDKPEGKDKWCIKWNFPVSFFTTKPRGGTLRFLKGGSTNRLTIQPNSTSFNNFCFTTSGCSFTDFKLPVNI